MTQKQGIFNISEVEYHADPCDTPSLSSSIAKIIINQSPRHAWEKHPRLNPAFEEDNDAKFNLGRADHAVILEGTWKKTAVIDPENHKAKNGSIPIGWTNAPIREARDKAIADGLTPILISEAADIELMVSAVETFIAKTEIVGHFENAKSELSIFWQEDEIWLRARMDKVFVMEDQGQAVIIDYKTTTDASPDAFGRIISQLSYGMQSAFYRRGLRAVRPDLQKAPVFLFLAQENSPPYSCSLHSLSSIAVEMAEKKVEKAIALWKWCMERDQWDAYPTEIHYQEPPAWEVNRFLDTQEEDTHG